MEKISIIIPIYNMEAYLERALDSIVRQTYSDWEALMIDDGSKDGSRQICEKYEKADKRFKYVYKENGGVSTARNIGLKMATGDYIAFLDPDDYLEPDMYNSLLKSLKANHADLAICGYRVVYGMEKNSSVTFHTQILSRSDCQERYFEGSKRATEMTVLWNKLIPRSYIKNLEFPVGRIQEDESVTYKLLYQARKVVYLDYPFYNYFVREDGYMNTAFNKSRFNLFEAYLERMSFYINHKEYELWKKLFLLYLHMLCQYRIWMKEASINYTDFYKKYENKLKQAYKMQQKKVKFPFRQSVECRIFMHSSSLYFQVWKLLKKKRG